MRLRRELRPRWTARRRHPVEPFRLHEGLRDEPSSFEVVFRQGDQQYRYGFEADATTVSREWLYVQRTREAVLFDRGPGDHFEVRPAMRAFGELKAMTRSNALFLSVAAQFNVPIAATVLDWFSAIGFLGGVDDESGPWTALQMETDPDFARRVNALICALDLGIGEITARSRALDRTELPAGMPGEVVDRLLEEVRHVEVSASHAIRDEAGDVVGEEQFDLEEHESGGTRKLFALAGPLLQTLARGTVIVIDELDARLHPLISRAIVKLFHDPTTNPRGAQLIALSHDTGLLDRKLLRRDQIWFVEKNRRGESSLYALSELKERNDAVFEQQYLLGRYGATPLLSGLEQVVGGAER
ncbi:MAG: ATP-binding protein [bacterium]